MQRTSLVPRTNPAARPNLAPWQQRPNPLPGTGNVEALHGPSCKQSERVLGP